MFQNTIALPRYHTHTGHVLGHRSTWFIFHHTCTVYHYHSTVKMRVSCLLQQIVLSFPQLSAYLYQKRK